jgi:hypothetical protein
VRNNSQKYGSAIQTLSSLLKDESMTGSELYKTLINLGQSRVSSLDVLYKELLTSDKIIHRRYASIIATGEGNSDVLMELVRNTSTVVHTPAAHGLAIHGSLELVLAIFSDEQVAPHTKSFLLKNIKHHRQELILPLEATILKLFGRDHTLRMLAYSPKSITDEELIKRVESYNVNIMPFSGAWTRSRPRASLLFLKSLHKRLSSNTQEQEHATVALTWNMDMIRSLMESAPKELAAELIDFLVEITFTPYKSLQTHSSIFGNVFGSLISKHAVNKCPEKMVELWKDVAKTYGVDSVRVALTYCKAVFFKLTVQQSTNLWDTWYEQVSDKTGASHDGRVLVSQMLQQFTYTHATAYNHARFYEYIKNKYGQQLIDFIVENHSSALLCNVHPTVGNLVAIKSLDKERAQRTLSVEEEAAILQYTNPLTDEKKRKHFQQMTNNSSPMIRAAVLRSYWSCAIYNHTQVNETTAFIAQRFINEPAIVKGVLLSHLVHYIIERVHKYMNTDLQASIEKIVKDAYFGAKSDSHVAYEEYGVLHKLIASHEQAKNPRDALRFALKLATALQGDAVFPEKVIRAENVDILEEYINKAVEKHKFGRVYHILSSIINPERSKFVKSILDQYFAKGGYLEQLTNSEEFEYSRTNNLLEMYFKMLPTHKERMQVLQRMLVWDPLLIMQPRYQRLLFVNATTSEERDAILAQYFKDDKLDIMFLSQRNQDSYFFEKIRVVPVLLFHTNVLWQHKIDLTLNEKQRKQFIKLLAFNELSKSEYEYNKEFIKLNAVIRVEEDEQIALKELIDTHKFENQVLKDNLRSSQVYGSQPGRVLPELLANITAENVILFSPAIQRCIQYLPVRTSFSLLKDAILNAVKRPEETKTVQGVSVQKELIRSMHCFIIDRTVRHKVYELVVQLWETKDRLHRDTRATLLHLVHRMFFTQRNDNEPKLKDILRDGVHDEYETAALVGCNLLKYREFHNSTNLQYQFQDLDLVRLSHTNINVMNNVVNQISTALRNQIYGLNVLLDNHHNAIVGKLLPLAMTFVPNQGHNTANTAISALVPICVEHDQDVIINMIKRLITEDEFVAINQEDTKVWDLPVQHRVDHIVNTLQSTLWDLPSHKRTKFTNLVESIKKLFQNDVHMYWRYVRTLNLAAVDFSSKEEVIAALEKIVSEFDKETIVYAHSTYLHASKMFSQATRLGMNESLSIEIANDIIAKHNSNHNDSINTKMWELIAAGVLHAASFSTEGGRKVVREMRTRKNNKSLQEVVRF